MSIEPHLHLVLLWYDTRTTPAKMWSVPLEFADVWRAPTPVGPFVHAGHCTPTANTWLRVEPPE